MRRAPTSTLFPYTTLFRSVTGSDKPPHRETANLLLYGTVPGKSLEEVGAALEKQFDLARSALAMEKEDRSEEHTSELQSLTNLVCRLLLEKKKTADREPSG